LQRHTGDSTLKDVGHLGDRALVHVPDVDVSGIRALLGTTLLLTRHRVDHDFLQSGRSGGQSEFSRHG
jgi:hypothetical protein